MIYLAVDHDAATVFGQLQDQNCAIRMGVELSLTHVTLTLRYGVAS